MSRLIPSNRHACTSRPRSPLRRAALVLLLLAGVVGADSTPLPSEDRPRLRIGLIVPLDNDSQPSYTDILSMQARMGALMGIDDAALGLDGAPFVPQLLLANAPTAEVARRSALRLIAADGVTILVGGVGTGQAEALQEVAAQSDAIFFNIGATENNLRTDSCGGGTFHIQASDTMYLDALVAGLAGPDHERWTLVNLATDDGMQLNESAMEAIRRFVGPEARTESVVIESEQLVFTEAIETLLDERPDVVLLLLPAVIQEMFAAQLEWFGFDGRVAFLPTPATQTRQHLVSFRESAPTFALEPRLALWDPAYAVGTAEELNKRFMSRWAEPMEAVGWAAYQAVRIAVGAAAEAQATDTAAIVRALTEPDARYDVAKELEAAFRIDSRQLQQQLLVVRTDPDARWDSRVSNRVALAEVIAALPSDPTTPSEPPTSAGGGSESLSLETMGYRETDCR